MSQEPQATLVERLRRGDHAAAEELVDQFYRRIYLYLRELGYGAHQSEDLTQETFMRAWKAIDQLHSERALSAWLYRIASNAAREQWRMQKRRQHLNHRQEDAYEPVALDRHLEKPELQEQYERLLQQVNGLSLKLKQAVVLHYLQEFTIAEAAEIAGIREGTLKSRLSRALEALRKQVAPD